MGTGLGASLRVEPVGGIGQVHEGDDLAALVTQGLRASGLHLQDGDILVLSSKVASKALGLLAPDGDKGAIVAAESEYVVAERSLPGSGRVTRVVRAKAGPIMAAAGVDGSNLGPHEGWLLLPHDPDAVCRDLHEGLVALWPGVSRLGIVLSDTAGRPWRVGQTDFALGAYAIEVVDDLRGAVDADGRALEVTTRAVADEIAGAADLAKGKVTGVPVALVRGLGHLVIPASEHVFGGRSLVRTGPDDWFGYGRVEAVRAALGVEPGSARSTEVGIAPVRGGSRADAVRRAVALALVDSPDASADAGQAEVTLNAPTPYELGRLSSRLETALWCEWLHGEAGVPSADGCSVTVRVTRPAR